MKSGHALLADMGSEHTRQADMGSKRAKRQAVPQQGGSKKPTSALCCPRLRRHSKHCPKLLANAGDRAGLRNLLGLKKHLS